MLPGPELDVELNVVCRVDPLRVVPIQLEHCFIKHLIVRGGTQGVGEPLVSKVSQFEDSQLGSSAIGRFRN